MTLLLVLIVVATALNGFLGGFSLEIAVVKLPTRHRIGPLAYATFARGSDLGNGLWFYPLMAISAALVTLAASLIAYIERQPTALLAPLSLAALFSIGHFLITARAAPTMLRVGKSPDDPALLAPLLDRFARWHTLRAALQALTFFLSIWALLVAR
jgi:hypothetical protein